MDVKRRQFIAGMASVFGYAVLNESGLLRTSSALESEPEAIASKPSRDIKDYPHITDVIPSKDMEQYFPIIVDACSDPKADYLSKIPFLIELEVCKIWKESRFEWNALSSEGAAGLQQLVEETARELGLTIAESPEIQKLNSTISEYKNFQGDIGAKRQELHELVESGSDAITEAALADLNRLRAELGDLYTKLATARQAMMTAKAEYIAKINSMTVDQRKEFDGRFVPELSIPVGVAHFVKGIIVCVDFFGGSVEMNVWRGIAAYNSGLERTKKLDGLPFIQETVQYTRNIVSDLTKALELKNAYSTKDAALIARTRSRLRLDKK